MKRLTLILFPALLGTLCWNGVGSAQPETAFINYLTALTAGRWEDAQACWHPEQIRASQRLGISYAGIKAKYDCASPLIGALGRLNTEEMSVAVAGVTEHGDWAELSICLSSARDSLWTAYYAVRHNGRWQLASRPFILARDWPQCTTKYFVMHVEDSTLVNVLALRELDEFVDSLVPWLKMADQQVRHLARRKVDYYLCRDTTITRCLGPAAQGMADLQFDAVISRQLPHRHELVHLLFNYSLDSLPLRTLPVLQEGMAVCYGGRWDKSPAVVFQLGRFALAEELLRMDDILTVDGFHFGTGVPDLSYAAGGLFSRFLIDRFGISRMKKLYRRLSGSDEVLRSLPAQDIREITAGICGQTWDSLQREFDAYWPQFEFSGLRPGRPGETGAICATLESPHISATVTASATCYSFEIRSTIEQLNAVVLVGDSALDRNRSYRSRLLAEHLPDTGYHNERYGILFTNQEAGLYDYLTNTLEAKYVLSFSPSADYWSPDDRILRFWVDKRLLPEVCDIHWFHLVER